MWQSTQMQAMIAEILWRKEALLFEFRTGIVPEESETIKIGKGPSGTPLWKFDGRYVNCKSEMMWVAILALCIWFGYSLVTVLISGQMDIFHRFFAGIPVGVFSISWVYFILTSISEISKYANAIAIPIVSAISLALTYYNHKRKLATLVHLNAIQAATYVVAGVFFIRIMYYSMLRNDVEVKGAAFGDLPFHLNEISSFATGANYNRTSLYSIDSVFYSGERLAYPIMTNFFTSVLIRYGGATLRASLFFSSSIMSLSLVVGMYYLQLAFHSNHIASAIGILLFVFIGGLGWVILLKPDHTYSDFVFHWEDGHVEYWFQSLTHVLIPQRASLFSMPLCYWALLLLINAVKTKKRGIFALAGIFVGFMPLVSVHSYAALAEWSIAFCLITFPYSDISKWKETFLNWSIFGLFSIGMGLPQIPVFMGRLSSSNDFVKLNPIWNTHERENIRFAPVILWWRGLGVFAAISLVFGWVSLNKQQRIMYYPSIIVFIIANIIRYQPWEMDNTKIFYAAWIPLALGVVGLFLAQLFGTKSGGMLSIILIFFAIFSGFLNFSQSWWANSSIFDRRDIKFGEWIAENTPPKAVFLTSQWHAHPVPTIAGRSVYLGYGGWVASHGLEWNNRNFVCRRLIDHPENIEDFKNLSLRYVVSKDHEFKEFEKLKSGGPWKKIFESRNYGVWKLE